MSGVNVGRIPRMRRFTDRSGNNPYTSFFPTLQPSKLLFSSPFTIRRLPSNTLSYPSPMKTTTILSLSSPTPPLLDCLPHISKPLINVHLSEGYPLTLFLPAASFILYSLKVACPLFCPQNWTILHRVCKNS